MHSPIGNDSSIDMLLRNTIVISDAQPSALAGCGGKLSSLKFPLGRDR